MTCFRFLLSCFLVLSFLMEPAKSLANQHHPQDHSNPNSAISNQDGYSSKSAFDDSRFGVYSHGESCLFGGAYGSYSTGSWTGRKSDNSVSSDAPDTSTFVPKHLRQDKGDQVDGRFSGFGN